MISYTHTQIQSVIKYQNPGLNAGFKDLWYSKQNRIWDGKFTKYSISPYTAWISNLRYLSSEFIKPNLSLKYTLSALFYSLHNPFCPVLCTRCTVYTAYCMVACRIHYTYILFYTFSFVLSKFSIHAFIIPI